MKQKPKIVRINTDLNSLISIKASERTKAKLENAGYTFINSFGGMFHSVSVYHLKH